MRKIHFVPRIFALFLTLAIVLPAGIHPESFILPFALPPALSESFDSKSRRLRAVRSRGSLLVEEKLAVVLEILKGEESVSAICRRPGGG